MLLKKKQMGQQRNQKGNEEKYLETNETGNTTFQNLWDTKKAALRGKFTVIQVYIKKQENN